MSKLERRTFGTVELRATSESRKIEGYASVFDSPADIGGMFRETVAKGAFKNAIPRDDVRALINHDENFVLGRNKAGTLRMSEDSTGLQIEIDPPDTQFARDLMVSMERGDVSQMSFAFAPDSEIWDFTEDTPERTLTDLRLYDVSVVTYPAYDDTSASVRSLQSAREAQLIVPTRTPIIGARLRMRQALFDRTRA